MKEKSCARTCSIITINCNVGTLSERPQEIPISTRRLKRRPPRSRFCEDVSGETLILGTFPDMNGKRVKEKSCARTCSIITIDCNVGELPERPQGIPIDARSPNVHKPVPEYPTNVFCTAWRFQPASPFEPNRYHTTTPKPFHRRRPLNQTEPKPKSYTKNPASLVISGIQKKQIPHHL